MKDKIFRIVMLVCLIIIVAIAVSLIRGGSNGLSTHAHKAGAIGNNQSINR